MDKEKVLEELLGNESSIVYLKSSYGFNSKIKQVLYLNKYCGVQNKDPIGIQVTYPMPEDDKNLEHINSSVILFEDINNIENLEDSLVINYNNNVYVQWMIEKGDFAYNELYHRCKILLKQKYDFSKE